jgi:GNAT superfamily N-acetyltransferase
VNPDSDLAHVATRLATTADHDAVVACVKAAYTPYIAEIGVAPAPLHDDYAAHIALGRVWLAVHSSGAVAGAMVILIDRDHLLIDNYAVYPEWQNCGISKRLTAVAMQQARRHGLDKLRLYTHGPGFEHGSPVWNRSRLRARTSRMGLDPGSGHGRPTWD